MRKQKIIAVYKGDTFLSVGTYKEISKELNIGYKTLQSLKSRYDKGLVKGNGLIIIELKEE